MSPADTAVVRVAWTPGRGEPSHRSELVTQWLCGERLEVEQEGEDGWLRVTGPGGYASWVDGGGVLRMEAGEAERWEEDADRISLGTDLRPASSEGPGAPGSDSPAPGGGGGPNRADVPRFVPWGARVAAAGSEGDDGPIRLPDGREAEPADADRLVAREECVLRFPARADALLATASTWTGVPYLWGGRTREGVDCSGYVQAVLALHGHQLPRDSDRQIRADEPVWRTDGGAGPGHDILAVAREVLCPGDLLFFDDGKESGEERVTHVAFSVADTEILHAAAGRGQVVRDDLAAGDPLMERLRSRLVAVTRPLTGEEDAGS